jgi:hypothetical protein
VSFVDPERALIPSFHGLLADDDSYHLPRPASDTHQVSTWSPCSCTWTRRRFKLRCASRR